MKAVAVENRRYRFPIWLLKQLYVFSLKEGFEGDLEEDFAFHLERGRRSAFAWVWMQTMRSLPRFIIHYTLWSAAMIQNYLRTAFRNMNKRKVFSFINVAGLAIGLAVSVLILLYVLNEVTYDRCHIKSEHVYRIATKINIPNRQMEAASAAGPLGPALVEALPEVAACARLRPEGNKIVTVEDKLFKEDGFLYADSGVMELFTVDVIAGDPDTFLDAPFSVILTEETADKYFGIAAPLGKILRFQNAHDFTVTGIVKSMPENSHLKFDFLGSLSTLERIGAPFERPDTWMGFNFHTYIELAAGASPESVTEKAQAILEENTAAMMEQLGVTVEHYLQSMRSIHLHSNIEGELEPGGNLGMIRVFTTIALFILLIACINFMNLATAQSVRRAKEVGMRKVCGAHRGKLIIQFLGESVLLALMGMAIAMVLIQALLPVFNGLISKTLTFHLLQDWPVTLALLGLAVFVGVLSGVYPAFFMSSYAPVEVLRTRIKVGKGHRVFRNVLVHLQYIISIALIFSTLVITSQLRFVRLQNLGFDKEHVVVVPLSGEAEDKSNVFKAEVLRLPGVERAALSTTVPGLGLSETMFTFEGVESTEPVVYPITDIDEDFLTVLGMEVVLGRNFFREHAGEDQSSILINETLARSLNWDNPLGKQISMTDVKEGGEFFQVPYRVLGVVKDFHFESLHAPIRPALMRMIALRDGGPVSADPPDILSVRIRAGQISETLDGLRAAWQAVEPGRPFEYRFLDDVFDQHYRTEERLGQIFMAFTGMAIFIACLGLFGLASFTAEQRTKEIGIRKVLGASISGVVVMLSKEFTKWVILANVVAWPIAWYAMNRWLEQFAYRVNMGVWMYLASGLLALVIAWLTVSLQTLRTASLNPVKTLRYE